MSAYEELLDSVSFLIIISPFRRRNAEGRRPHPIWGVIIGVLIVAAIICIDKYGR